MKPMTEMTNSELYDLNIEYTKNPFLGVPDDVKSVVNNKINYTNKNLTINYDEVYVGNLDNFISYEELHEFLSRFGDVDYINMIMDKNVFIIF